jgi:outer membrane protein assembly factor BamB
MKMRSCSRTLGLVLLAVGFSASDWPQWQGPDRTDLCRETGLLKSWPASGPPLLWKATGLGQGYSTPSIAAGRIYTMGNVDNNECVMALDDAVAGKIIWSTPIGAVRSDGGGMPGPRSTPTVDGDLVFALGMNGDLVCLESATGKPRWHVDLVKDFGGEMMSQWAFCESPLVDGDRLVCTPGGKDATMVALDKQTGSVIWKAEVPSGDKAGYSSIVIADVDGIKQYVQLTGKGLIGIDAASGKFLWRYNRMANRVANISTPIVRGNLVFCSTSYGAGSALVRLERVKDGIEAHEIYFLPGKIFENHHGGVVLVGDYLYGGHGRNLGVPVCIEFATGKVMWRHEKPAGTRSAAVLYADGEVYFRYENGVLALVDASPAGYHERARFKLPDNSGKPSWPHPVIANGKLYIRDQDTLLCFDVKKH